MTKTIRILAIICVALVGCGMSLVLKLMEKKKTL